MYNKYGLDNEEVIFSRKKYGSNSITNLKTESLFHIFLETLGDPIIKILLIVLAIKVIFLFKDFDWYETIGIVIAIMLASLISTISEYGSQKAFQRLTLESSKVRCRVRRNSMLEEINIDDVVVNDIVVLNAGDKIAADGIIIDGKISVDESMMNGEAKEVYKDIINNKVFRGTIVYDGQALMLVTDVGNNTFYGKLALELQEKNGDSPLKIRLTNLARLLSKIGYVCAFLVFISYLFSKIVIENNFNINLIMSTITNFPLLFGHILHALTLSVTVIVVVVPDGLLLL